MCNMVAFGGWLIYLKVCQSKVVKIVESE